MITCEYDKCLISIPKSCIFKTLKPTLGNDIVATFTMNNLEGASLYDLIEIDEEMVLLMVKEQLNCYRIIK